MPQNIISLSLTDADHADVASALSTLETKLAGLISLSTSERRRLSKMGEKSETFCRRALVTMNENPTLIPAEVDVADAMRDMAQLDALRPRADGQPYESQITYVADRPGHDRRYAIDPTKIQRDIGWSPAETFESGIDKTVRWYLENGAWIDTVRSGAYRDWLNTNYAGRAA